MIKLLVAAVLAFMLSSCSDGSTPVSITNQSSEQLKAVQATGPGFAAYIGDLGPGERRNVKIYPRGEAGLGLTFIANNRQFTSPTSGYFESGYNVSVIVEKDMSVAVDGEL